MKLLLDEAGISRTLVRLSHEILERNERTDNLCFIGIKRGGEIVARRIADYLASREGLFLPCGGIDIGMYRDDLVSAFFVPEYTKNELGFDVTGKKVILCDDVLFTGRSARAAIEAIFALGRPASIQFLALVDRGGRELPVRADYVGKNVPTSHDEHIEVNFKELTGTDGLSIVRKKEDYDAQ